jgi:transposase-like protein
MRRAVNKLAQTRKARARLRMIQHYEQMTRNASQTCRFFGVSRAQFYTAMICI